MFGADNAVQCARELEELARRKAFDGSGEVVKRLELVDILLLTARTAKEQVVEALQAGADDYLTKPFDKEELHARFKAGLRVLMLQRALSKRVEELEAALEENRSLKLQLPL